jgi:hypothetical protein
MLDSVVSERLGIKTLVVSGSGEEVDKQIKVLRKDTGMRRTVARIGGDAKDQFIRERNPLIKAMDPLKAGVQECENGVCKDILKVSS